MSFKVTESPTGGNAVHSVDVVRVPKPEFNAQYDRYVTANGSGGPTGTSPSLESGGGEGYNGSGERSADDWNETEPEGGPSAEGASKTGLQPIYTENLKIVETKTPEVANNEWQAKGYNKPPYDTSFEVKIVQAGSESYVRVFSYNTDGTSNKLGGWIMRKSDIEGLTPTQIADKYALPKEPTHICDVIVKPEFELQTGIACSVEKWGQGGGQQFDTLGKRLPISSFINEKRISE